MGSTWQAQHSSCCWELSYWRAAQDTKQYLQLRWDLRSSQTHLAGNCEHTLEVYFTPALPGEKTLWKCENILKTQVLISVLAHLGSKLYECNYTAAWTYEKTTAVPKNSCMYSVLWALVMMRHREKPGKNVWDKSLSIEKLILMPRCLISLSGTCDRNFCWKLFCSITYMGENVDNVVWIFLLVLSLKAISSQTVLIFTLHKSFKLK